MNSCTAFYTLTLAYKQSYDTLLVLAIAGLGNRREVLLLADGEKLGAVAAQHAIDELSELLSLLRHVTGAGITILVVLGGFLRFGAKHNAQEKQVGNEGTTHKGRTLF